jgi:DNA helicase HerA-like ATPase
VLTSTDAHHDAEIEILTDAILTAKKRYLRDAAPSNNRLRRTASADPGTRVTVDTPCPFLLSNVVSYIDEQSGKLDRSQALLPFRRLKARIEALVGDARYGFMFGTLSIEDNMVEVLGRLFRMPSEGKPITVIDLSPVPAEILDVVISLIARLGMDFCTWCDGKMPLHLVCEEAHRYAPAVQTDRFLPTRRSLARIAKEGRKYGMSLALVTQRPSELDTTIISQCSTIVAMRLSTERDQDVVRANTNEGTLQLLDFLPLLGEREAIVLGQGVPMPMRIRFHELEGSQTRGSNEQGFSPAWKNTKIDRQQVESVVARWRNNGQIR